MAQKIVASRTASRIKRHERLRLRLSGTQARPRLAVFRSLNHIYAQVIDDMAGRTLVAAGSGDKDLKAAFKTGGNMKAAESIGTAIGERAKKAGVTKVVFDRNGFIYHGRIKALADAARKAGLQF